MCAGGTPNGGAGRKAGSLGVLCPVCGRSAGVSCRTRLRWPTPVRLRRTVVSKERITGAVLMEELPGRRTFPSAFLFLFPPSLNAPSDFCVSAAAGFPAFPISRLRSLNARGPRATSGARPTAASSRNSFPALNADAVVQVEQFVKRVWSRRAMALHMLLARCRQDPGRRA